MATRLGISPNEVERMYLDRAEDLIEFWGEEAGGSAPTRAMSAREIAAEFGGQVVGAPRHG